MAISLPYESKLLLFPVIEQLRLSGRWPAGPARMKCGLRRENSPRTIKRSRSLLFEISRWRSEKTDSPGYDSSYKPVARNQPAEKGKADSYSDTPAPLGIQARSCRRLPSSLYLRIFVQANSLKLKRPDSRCSRFPLGIFPLPSPSNRLTVDLLIYFPRPIKGFSLERYPAGAEAAN